MLSGKLLSVSQELLHAVVVVGFQEVFEALLDPKLLICVSQQPKVDNGHHVLALLGVRTPHHYDKVLFSLRTQLQSDPFGQLLRNRVLNEPRLVLYLTVYYVLGLLPVALYCLRVDHERQLRVIELLVNMLLVVLETVAVYR